MSKAMSDKTKILIVEDEIAIRTGLVDVFVFHGYEVDFADNGEEGLNKALSGLFDLILLDVMLPGINGYEVCEIIRLNPKWRKTKKPFIIAFHITFRLLPT